MKDRRIKLILLRAIAFLALASLVVLSVSVALVRRSAETQAETGGRMVSVTRNGRTVTFVECPECEKSMRIASDGMSATINLCRLRDGNPDAKEFARRRDEMVERAFALMEDKAAEAARSMDTDNGRGK